MTALEEIKKTSHPDRIWATVNGMSTRLPDGARHLVGGWSQDADRTGAVEYVLASTLESLQRENEELSQRLKAPEPELTCPHIDKLVQSGELSVEAVEELYRIRDINSMLRYGFWHEKARAEAAEAEVKRLTAPETIECACTKIAQDETCPVGYQSLLCETCDGKRVLPYVELDGPELWEIVFGVNDDVAGEITDEQYDQIAKAINDVFIAPLRARKTLASTGGEHNAE